VHAVDDHQLRHAPGGGDRGGVGNGAAPIVGHHAEGARRRQAIAQGQHVAHQLLDAIGLKPEWLARQSIAALVRRHRMVAVGEGGQDLLPGAGVFGKTMQEQD
jgi:hypothetical protein